MVAIPRLRVVAGLVVIFVMLMSAPTLAAVKISYIKFDPAGTDTRSKLNREYITVKNTGPGA